MLAVVSLRLNQGLKTVYTGDLLPALKLYQAIEVRKDEVYLVATNELPSAIYNKLRASLDPKDWLIVLPVANGAGWAGDFPNAAKKLLQAEVGQEF